MTETIQIALIAGLPPTIAGIGTFIMAVRNSSKVNEIHVLVNSNMTAVKADLAFSIARVEKLEALLTEITVKKSLP